MIYIDTGAFLARYVSRDQYHEKAVESWDRLERLKERCFTSNLVLNETFTLLARRASYKFAAERARNIYSSKLITILRSTEEEEIEAVQLLQRFADQEVSFTDCVSFVLMRKWRIRRVFSFDRHFGRAGFQLFS